MAPSSRSSSAAATRASDLLLVIGYVVAIWASLKLVPVWRERRLGRFLAFETGTAMVAAGHAIAHRRLSAAINGAVAVALLVAWALRPARR